MIIHRMQTARTKTRGREFAPFIQTVSIIIASTYNCIWHIIQNNLGRELKYLVVCAHKFRHDDNRARRRLFVRAEFIERQY